MIKLNKKVHGCTFSMNYTFIISKLINNVKWGNNR